MATFVPDLPLAGLRGADYNPRRIDETALEGLRHSLSRLGVCKPIIVSGDLIVAGHQRTKSLRKLGIDRAPAVVLKAVSTEDEIRFNQRRSPASSISSGQEAGAWDGLIA